jgi:methanogenic corrinoid protein MtbC1
MVEEDLAAADRVAPASTTRNRAQPVRRLLDRCLDAVERLDGVALETTLSNAAVDLTVPVLVEQLLDPLMTEIGERWRDGTYRVAHEHFATTVVRSFMGVLRNVDQPAEGAPEIVVASPAGSRHEIGALAVSVLAASDGWRVTHLGADLPAEEIVAATRSRGAKAVALSLVYPMDDTQLGRELTRLGSQLGNEIALFVGGPAAGAYREVLEGVGAQITPDVATLRAELEKLRNP